MIAMLCGRVEQISGRSAILDVQGVGYEVACSTRCLEKLKIGAEIKLDVYTDVKQDNIRLYAFADQLERQVFLMLIQVQGLGARSASDILSRIDKRDLLRAIGTEDLQRLQGVKGVGKKTAQRLVVELKDKVASLVEERELMSVGNKLPGLTPAEEAIQALEALGFIRRDAERAVQAAQAQAALESAASGQIVKEALRYV